MYVFCLALWFSVRDAPRDGFGISEKYYSDNAAEHEVKKVPYANKTPRRVIARIRNKQLADNTR
jgi:hypothetical protein